jgi:hypothetical protein
MFWMATATQTRWQEEACLRWTHRRILGDGHFCVLICGGDLRLTDDESFARGMVNDECNSRGTCDRRHTAFDLRLPHTHASVIARSEPYGREV